MERTVVKSGAITSIGFQVDNETQRSILEIEFPSKAIWRYFDVPLETYNKLMKAESIGRYFSVEIRACFKSERVHIQECGEAVGQHNAVCPCWCHNLTKSSEEKSNDSGKDSTTQRKNTPKAKRPNAKKDRQAI